MCWWTIQSTGEILYCQLQGRENAWDGGSSIRREYRNKRNFIAASLPGTEQYWNLSCTNYSLRLIYKLESPTEYSQPLQFAHLCYDDQAYVISFNVFT